MYINDQRIVLTLDAGGTNFVFSAVQAYKEVGEHFVLPAVSDDLDKCLEQLVYGFETIKSTLDTEPVAISFAFPGPADYKNGIIGDLPNFKAFRGGVALGPYLYAKFQIPVYINNDGNLFAYGEALHGALPMVNYWLSNAGNPKRYSNLLGITLGTGFGAGVVINKTLLTGDNGCGGDVWIMKNKKYPNHIVEESVSIRAVKRVYQELSGKDTSNLTPKDIFDIAEGNISGDRDAAIRSFEEMGEMIGDIMTYALTLVDGIVVIGGGLTGASKYILKGVMKELDGDINMFGGTSFSKTQMDIYNLMDEEDKSKFLQNEDIQVKIPGSDDLVHYNKTKKTGIVISHIGTSEAVMYGAYAYALQQLDS
ncbi:MAG: ROK family protein [Prevotella sp.]|jgi:glucokinase|nr:ROK family protein [Prevotella sp.]